ncbi:MAG: exonuclease SbcCD subunit D [Lachnospiraceae bacterium]
MKFFHLSDLHIGKQLYHYNLKEDQETVLEEVISYAKAEGPDVVVIAGDIYDKAIPSAEAVTIFDWFLTKLTQAIPAGSILIIGGNHDSPQRLEFAREILGQYDIHIVGTPPREEKDHVKCVTISDVYGEVDFYLLPFLKPGMVRQVCDGAVPESYDEGIKKILAREKIDTKRRNVLVSHQFYTASGKEPKTCDSETISVGGMDQVDTGALEPFDYVALGHIHGPQSVGAPHIRYCGTLLKYSVSEWNQEKSLTMVTLGEKGTAPKIQCLPLHPLRNVRKKIGLLPEIIQEATQETKDDYVSVTLQDEVDPYQPKDQLEAVYSHVLEVRVDNQRTRKRLEVFADEVALADPLTIFGDFYREIQGQDLSKEEREIMEAVLEQVKEERE